MIPIQALLSRIRWDADFGAATFEIGYYDRTTDGIHRVALQEVRFPSDERRVFELMDPSAQWQRVPFHRVRELWRNGTLIWHRTGKRRPG